MGTSFEVAKHYLVPKHSKASEKEKEDLLKRYNISLINLPKISPKDPAIVGMKPKEGDIIKVMRQNPHVGETVFYRCVSNA